MEDHAMEQDTETKRGSLVRRNLVRMGGAIAIIILAMTILSYNHIVTQIEHNTQDELSRYVTERTQREKAIFILAEDNHETLKAALLARLTEMGNTDPAQQFNRLFERQVDGVIRNRPAMYNNNTQACVYVDESLALTSDVRRRVLAFYELANQYGPAWKNRYVDTWFLGPENIVVNFIPGFDWCSTAGPDLNLANEEFFWVSDREHDPTRESVWTGIYYDPQPRLWMVSCATPLDIDGRHVATIGHDITLNTLFDNTINDHLEGAYNFVIRADGRLIVHPELTEQIQQAGGNYDVMTTSNEHLKTVYQLIHNRTGNETVLDNEDYHEYIAVSTIEGPDWHFVTVYPKDLVEEQAYSAALRILVIGLFALVILVALLFIILRQKIALPITRLLAATERVSSGDYSATIEVQSDDEIGVLADGFRNMQTAVQEKILELDDTVQRMEKEAQERAEAERTIREQSEALTELSTPVVKVWEGIVMLPLVGAMDTARASFVTERLLRTVSGEDAEVVILDVTGLPGIDTSVARHLLQAVESSRILGCEVIITGFSPDAAQTLAQLGVDFSSLRTKGSLSAGIVEAFELLGNKIVKK